MLLPFRARLPYFGLVLSLLAASCTRKEEAAPAGAITGAMAPVAGVGQLLKVTAIAADKTEYTATPDPQTGAFSFPTLPPGKYTVKFSTTAAPDFPYWVVTEVVAGATATPPIPPITHDNIGRGTFKWTMNGKAYSATGFIKVKDTFKAVDIQARSGSFGTSAEVHEAGLALLKNDGKGFVGVGTYALGTLGPTTPCYGTYTYYGASPMYFIDYTTYTVTKPSGRATFMRYDGEQGIATGTFAFDAARPSGTGAPGAPNQVAVMQGEFDITF
jgi:hypothetical protein